MGKDFIRKDSRWRFLLYFTDVNYISEEERVGVVAKHTCFRGTRPLFSLQFVLLHDAAACILIVSHDNCGSSVTQCCVRASTLPCHRNWTAAKRYGFYMFHALEYNCVQSCIHLSGEGCSRPTNKTLAMTIPQVKILNAITNVFFNGIDI